MMTVGKEVQTGNTVDVCVNGSDYKKLIIEMVEKMDNQVFLRFTYNLLNSFKKKWGI